MYYLNLLNKKIFLCVNLVPPLFQQLASARISLASHHFQIQRPNDLCRDKPKTISLAEELTLIPLEMYAWWKHNFNFKGYWSIHFTSCYWFAYCLTHKLASDTWTLFSKPFSTLVSNLQKNIREVLTQIRLISFVWFMSVIKTVHGLPCPRKHC